jgi:hypothetical protein
VAIEVAISATVAAIDSVKQVEPQEISREA